MTDKYSEDEYLQLSGLYHFTYCRRRWALIHIEQQWDENVFTVEGDILHEKAHDGYTPEKRGNVIVSRGMPVCSRELGITGACDIVEFYASRDGIALSGRDGRYAVLPVEYKRGSHHEQEMELIQLAAQAMCLEEMLCCDVPEGCVYYGETRRRLKVQIDEALRERVRETVAEMHDLYRRKYTPKVKKSKACRACSLADLCLPKLSSAGSALSYIKSRLKEDEAL